SNQIRESFLGAPEIGDAYPQKDYNDSQTHEEPRCIKLTFAAEKGPAKAINDSHDRIEAVPESPHLGHHRARKTYRRYIEAHLNDERNNVAKVSVLHVKSRDQERRPQARQHSHRNEARQQNNLPAWHETVPSHQAKENEQIYREVHQRYHGCRGW